MAKSSVRQGLLSDLERDIGQELRKSLPVDEPHNLPRRTSAPPLAMPDYVEHRDGATEIGKLSAEAVVHEYEAAAKTIEAIGAELINRVKQCEAMTRDAHTANEQLREVAERYREEARRVFLQIEACSLMTAEVRKTCTELKKRIAVPDTADGLVDAGGLSHRKFP